MDLLFSILSLIGFILLTASTGLFVAVEFALTGLERATIDQDLNTHNDSRAHAVKRAFHNLSFVLSGAQLGITITTLATGYLAEPILAKFLNPLLRLTGLSETWTTPTALVLALIIATFLSMVFGELVPKNIAITNPIRTARFTIQPAHALNLIFKGFITLLNKTANALVRAIGIEPADELATARSAQELTTLVRNSVGDDGFDVDLLTRAFQQGPLLFDGGAHALAQKLAVENVLDANAQTRRLVRVGRSDPPTRRADPARPQTSLAKRVEDLAKRGDDMRIG